MKINEVSKITGLSEKSIRFYEEKELIVISRNESGYRVYNDYDVDMLLKIKMLRKCGLSVNQIKESLNNNDELHKILYQKIDEINKQELSTSIIKDLCKDVIEANGNYEKLYKTVNYLETDDYQEFNNMLIELDKPSLPRQIIITLMLLAPLFYNYLYLDMQKYNLLPYTIIISFISAIILSYTWIDFIKRYKYYNETYQQGINKTIIVLISCIVGIILMIGLFIVLSSFQINVFLVDDAFMISSSRIHLAIFLGIGIECFIIFLSFLSRYYDIELFKNYNFIIPIIKKYTLPFIIINIVMIYIGLINITVYTPNGMTCYSTFHPSGEKYAYKDVKSIETGFYKNGFLLREKGEFYYHITLSNNKVIKVDNTQTTPYYEEDTYSELVELDNLIMKFKPKKEGTTKYSEYLMMDDIYIERFKNIVNNK